MRTPNGNEYNLRIIRLPLSVYGLVVLLPDDTYDVFINGELPEEVQNKALSHEVRHIDGGHLYNDIDPVFVMEYDAVEFAEEKK